MTLIQSRSIRTASMLLAVLLMAAGGARAADLKTQNIVLITTDGLRWQEVFTGAEKALINKEHGGVADVAAIEAKFWRETPEERREALLPFFWKKIAREGQLYGNLPKGSSSQITNTMKFSYPGYNEILTGFADPRIDSNAKKPNQNITVLEWLHRKPGFGGKVAAYSAWDVVPYIVNRERCGFPVMGGWEPLPEANPNPRQQLLNDLIADTTRPNSTEVIDSFLYQAAREHLLRHKPRVLFVGFLETDAWGHAGRYDNLLTSANAVDQYIQRLWETMQSMEQYRDKTTFIITTDHGRGSGLADWKNHGKTIEGAEDMWMAFLGPDTPPLGERTNCDRVTQSQIAATLAALLGEDYHGVVPNSGSPIQQVLPAAKEAKRLKVLCNNVGIFPQQIVALYPAKLKEKKQNVIADEEERAAQLARVLLDCKEDPDVVLLQEIWSIKARDRLIKDLAQEYPHCKYPSTVGGGTALLQPAGLIVFSKYPLEDFAFQEFTRGVGEDKLARKGIVGARLTKEGRSVAVFTTHLQAGGKRDPSIRPDQLRECNQFIREFVADHKGELVVLAGDFNIHSTDTAAYGAIFKQLAGARDSYQEKLGPLTTTTRSNEDPNKRIDYLFTFGDVEAASTIVDPAGPRISDHLAIFGTVPLD